MRDYLLNYWIMEIGTQSQFGEYVDRERNIYWKGKGLLHIMTLKLKTRLSWTTICALYKKAQSNHTVEGGCAHTLQLFAQFPINNIHEKKIICTTVHYSANYLSSALLLDKQNREIFFMNIINDNMMLSCAHFCICRCGQNCRCWMQSYFCNIILRAISQYKSWHKLHCWTMYSYKT